MGSKRALLIALYSFASPNNLFKYLKGRHCQQQIHELNHLLKLKGKCVRTRENITFLRKCLELWITPTHIQDRVRKSKPKKPSSIERAFIRDEINKQEDFLQHSKEQYYSKWPRITEQLSFMDLLRFCKLLSSTTSRLEQRVKTKNSKSLQWLVKKQLGSSKLLTSAVTNLSNVELSQVEMEVLCRGLKFGVLPRVDKESVLAEFELCWQQLRKATPVSEDKQQECKAAMADFAHKYANTTPDKTGFPLENRHLKAMASLKRNKDIIITRPDKGNGVVILDREDYNSKMHILLSDSEKFQKIGDADTHDRTIQQERALQAFLLREKNAGNILKEVYERIRPVGATRPRMYGVPKVHKPGTPLRPILSMINSPQHEMAKWLAEVLRPVVTHYSQHTVDDTFQFCNDLDEFTAHSDVSNTYMCSFDIASLFTNIPLEETITICLDFLYRSDLSAKPSIPEKLLRKLLLKATTEVEFSFNNTIYKQVDGVAMGSPLGPVLANIFVGYCETKLDPELWPMFYRRYVDDTFSIFHNETKADEFFTSLNNLHPALRFTVEGETNNELPFLDVLNQRVEDTLVRSVYRKPTFTGLYTRWDSFCDTGPKVSLVKSLVARAIKICSPLTLDQELMKLRDIFANNGYPVGLTNKIIKEAIKRIPSAPRDTETVSPPPTKDHAAISTDEPADQPKPVFLKLPWLGKVSGAFRRDIKTTVESAFSAVVMRVIFTNVPAFSGRAKDVLPATSKSSVIYKFTCSCERTYVGKTTQQLAERIKQHIPSNLRAERSADSAITKHLKQNPKCTAGLRLEPDKRFTILAQARNTSHLDVLEAIFIKKLSPALCLQKKFVTHLHLF